MSGADSFQLILNELVKEINEINDRLAVVGIYYLGKITLKTIGKLYTCSRSYIIPILFSNDKWLKSLGNWAIVTGCINPIGLGYSKELAKRGINLILIDKNSSLLDQLAAYLTKNYKVEVVRLVVDLNSIDSYSVIEKSIISRDIGLLVNAISLSNEEPCIFHNFSKKQINESININVTSVSQMTRMVLPYMFQKNKGAIVYFSSGKNSFLPSPFNAVNAATYCYVQKLSESLSYEYSNTNLHFQCLRPFFFKTKSGLNKTNDWLKYSQYSIKTLGYATNTYGEWFMGLQMFLIQLMPRRIFNYVYARILRIFYLNHTSGIFEQHEDTDKNFKIILDRIF